jgi:heat-inducible transcriptional repressor
MLAERQALILTTIIRNYVQTGKAVGSKVLVEELQLNVSSATVRNEMAVLERLGFIEKEHTSSGRIPAEAGYRHYVDALLPQHAADRPISEAMQRAFSRNFQQVDDVLASAVEELAQLTGYTVMALKPESRGNRLSGFRLVPLDGQQVMAIIVTNDGEVTSQSFRLPPDMDIHELDNMVQYINQTLVGQLISDVLATIASDYPMKTARVIRTPVAFLQLFGDVLARTVRDDVFIGGRLNMLDFSDQVSPQHVKRVYELIESPQAMRQLVDHMPGQITINIGRENDQTLLQQYSLLSTTFDVPGHGLGALALIGPTAMMYGQTTEALEQFREGVKAQLREYY